MNVKSLWRYPVKSLLGEPLTAARIMSGGIEGDRDFALRDGDAILSAKRNGALFRAAARYVDGRVEITWPDGTVSFDDDAEIDERLTALSGRSVVLARRSHGETVEIVKAFDSSTTEGPDGFFTAPPGTFFDSASLHILTTSSLEYLRKLYPDGSIDERRFRPNILVDSGDEAVELEQSWVGHEVRIGDTVVSIVKSCSRCVMTTHAQSELPQDRGVLKTLARSTGNVFGVMAEVVTPGTVHVGDDVSPARMPG